jgi:hypothetical protein
MYVDFEYYSSAFGGSVMSEETFQKAEQEAETYIRYLTYLNGDIFADTAQADAIKGAVCAAADACYMAVKETAEGGNVKSESRDGLSVSLVVARKDGETADDYIKRCMYRVIRIRLLPIGWLSRKVRCAHDHKCGCCDCL